MNFDKTILSLLFNYKGTITYREFRVGIIIVFICLGTYASSSFITIFDNAIAGRLGGGQSLAASTIYYQITNSFIPNLIPVWFIVSYCSFVLALKRSRALKDNCAVGIISGIINYLFFASIVAQFYLAVNEIGFQGGKDYMYLITPALVYAISAFFLMGILNLVYLSTRRKTEQHTISYTKGRLDASGYAIKLGNIMAIMAILTLAIVIIVYLLDLSLYDFDTIHHIIIGIYFIVPLIFYIKYAVYRLKDANISILWLSTILIYLILFVLKVWISLKFQDTIAVYYNTFFAVATSFYTAMYFLLFLLPTNNDKGYNLEERE